MNCKEATAKRHQCHNLYGKQSEDCLVQELEEKRCLSFQNCALEARAYYGTPSKDSVKAKGICASWAEAFCFANPTVIFEEEILDHHLRAQERVNKDTRMKANCRTIAMELVKCLQLKRKY